MEIPQPFSFVRKENITVAKFLASSEERNFRYPLYFKAQQQWNELQTLLLDLDRRAFRCMMSGFIYGVYLF